MSTQQAFVAATRFGLGPTEDELARIGSDPRGWLLGQIDRDTGPPPALSGLPRGVDQARLLLQAREKGNAELEAHLKKEYRQSLLVDIAAHTEAAIGSTAPFRERLVRFWANHFTVSAQRPAVAGLAGAFEREAIRPNVTGRFETMLVAAIQHPAMLLYLDNAVSIGPNSPAGRRREKGLNENLGREILELHTLGVNGGYTQADVRSLATIITGWTIARLKDSNAGQYTFAPPLHEPGPKMLLGVRYEARGEEEGLAALRALARHPATAQHVARKLAVHFIGDDPPPAAVDRLARLYLEQDGRLLPLYRALIDGQDAWQRPLEKLKTPQEFIISTYRATGQMPQRRALLEALERLAQVPFTAPSPAGWPDSAAAWVAPEASVRRVEWAVEFAGRLQSAIDPVAMAGAVIGPVASKDTLEAVALAPSWRDGVALVLASPEFQRR
ncbi:MAG: DUF1800 domain-containing protein [Alphaproteobacteria bacterium]